MKHENNYQSQLKKKTWKSVGIKTTTYAIKEKAWKSFGI
jgi:hypothetical protein